MYRKLSLLPLFIALFFACSKDEHAAPTEGVRLRRVMAGTDVQTEYFYNAAGQINQIISKNISENKFYYDGKGRLTKKEDRVNYSNSTAAQQWSESYTEYGYDEAGRISTEKTYLKVNGQYQLASKQTHTYDASSKLTSTSMVNAADVPQGKTVYTYNSNGNITTKEDYGYKAGNYTLAFKYTYDEFDDKQNPYRQILYSVLPYFVNVNNIRRTTTYNYNLYPGSVETSTDVSEYRSYNNQGLPVEVAENGSVFIYQYE